ncbi:hypothetical protein FB639_003829, partial [Coemansia asiatica]
MYFGNWGLAEFILKPAATIFISLPHKSVSRSGGILWTSVPYGIFASTMLALLMPGIMAREGFVVQIGVVVYAVAIAFMAYKATVTRKSLLVFGTILFCISDSILAWNRFVQSYEWCEYAVM